MKFKVGQVWRARNKKDKFVITEIDDNMLVYKILAIRIITTTEGTYTFTGCGKIGSDSEERDFDLIELISEPESEDEMREVKDEDFINLEDGMPALNKYVDVDTVGGHLHECILSKHKDDSYIFITKYGNQIVNVLGWRNIKEKKPDFSKLNKEDLLVFKYVNKKLESGFYCMQIDDEISTSRGEDNRDTISYKKDLITKITRINLEDETFEEI